MCVQSDARGQMANSNSQRPSGFWSLSRVHPVLGFTWPVRQPSLCPTLYSQPRVIGGESSEAVPLRLSGPNLSEVTGRSIVEDVDLQIDAVLLVFQNEVSDSDKLHGLSCKGLDMP